VFWVKKKMLPGERYDRWTVVADAPGRHYLCRCDCGTERTVTGSALRRGRSRSCGCIAKDQLRATRKHGMSLTTIYNLWGSMVSRCNNPTHQAFPNYGGRGIKVCDRWLSFENFYTDMGERPEGKELDRINNDGPYSPENCRWATPRQQGRNRRTNRVITFNGKSMCVADWADELGLSSANIYLRLSKGWSVEEALTTPRIRKGLNRYRIALKEARRG
jgi:hypothetical protein